MKSAIFIMVVSAWASPAWAADWTDLDGRSFDADSRAPKDCPGGILGVTREGERFIVRLGVLTRLEGRADGAPAKLSESAEGCRFKRSTIVTADSVTRISEYSRCQSATSNRRWRESLHWRDGNLEWTRAHEPVTGGAPVREPAITCKFLLKK